MNIEAKIRKLKAAGAVFPCPEFTVRKYRAIGDVTVAALVSLGLVVPTPVMSDAEFAELLTKRIRRSETTIADAKRSIVAHRAKIRRWRRQLKTL